MIQLNRMHRLGVAQKHKQHTQICTLELDKVQNYINFTNFMDFETKQPTCGSACNSVTINNSKSAQLKMAL
jgi:hypothetical protein